MNRDTPSGAGTRPATDGTIDNIGAGSAFDPVAADHDSPAPKERLADKRADAASVEQDGSAPLGLTEDAESVRHDPPPGGKE